MKQVKSKKCHVLLFSTSFVFYIPNLRLPTSNYSYLTWDQVFIDTLHRLVINFKSTTTICLWWNILISFPIWLSNFETETLTQRAWVCFVYTRLSSLGVASLKWPKYYYLENSRTRNSKQSVYSWRSTCRILMYYQCKSA